MFGSDWPDRPTTAKVGGDWFHVVESPAAAVIERMETMTSFRDKALGALIALNEDPGCIEAHLFLAQHTDDEDKRFVHLARAVQTGRDLWEPIAAVEEGFAYWGVTATRPYTSRP